MYEYSLNQQVVPNGEGKFDMRLAVDANIFVSELIRQRGRALIELSEFELFVAEAVWGEAQYELRKRIHAMIKQDRLSLETANLLYNGKSSRHSVD